MRFKFVDDLTVLELLLLGDWLSNYNFKLHVANDIGLEENFISPDNLQTQSHLNEIAKWTASNEMKLNEEKCKYMIFTRSLTEIATRFEINS